LVARASVETSALQGSEEQQQEVEKIWQSASVASAIGQMLGQELGVDRPSVLATKALFTNLGDVAMVLGFDEGWSWYTDGMGLIERVSAQQQATGVDAAVLGTLLAQYWQLPDEISQALEASYQPLKGVLQPVESERRPEQLENVLIYVACRVGERATYQGLRDIREFVLCDSEVLELFFLPEHLANVGATRLPLLFNDAAFCRKINRLLSAYPT